jgi:predicted ATPase
MIMPDLLVDRIIQSIEKVRVQHHRLVILAGPAGSGKTQALRDVHDITKAPLINVNLELSRRMLDLTELQRSLKLPSLLTEIVGTAEVVLLDNIEIFFDRSLEHDPMQLLKKVSENKTIVVAWSGTIDGKNIIYAESSHHEHIKYLLQDFIVVIPEIDE